MNDVIKTMIKREINHIEGCIAECTCNYGSTFKPVVQYIHETGYVIYCPVCGIKGSGETPIDAIRSWNGKTHKGENENE